MKRCFKCGADKPRSEFYAHPTMADGLLGKCKQCAKKDVAARALLKRDELLEYDRKRAMLPHRVASRKVYARTERGRIAHAKALKRSAAKFPEKARARLALSNAVRDGKVKRKPCEICCNPKSQGHHDDYSKPLEVRWLCSKHHREVHKNSAPGSQA